MFSNDQEIPRLIILHESLHYRYYQWLLKMWSIKKPAARMSFCKYWQTMFWYTVFFIISIPFIFMGWVILKSYRILYKMFLPFDKVIDWLDNSKIGKVFDIQFERIEEGKQTPVFLETSVFFILVTFLSGMLLLGVFLAIKYGIENLYLIPEFLWDVICFIGTGIWYVVFYIGWGIFHVCSFIGFGLVNIWHALNFTVKHIWIFLKNPTVWEVLFNFILYVASAGLIMFAVGFAIWKLTQTKTYKNLIKYFEFKLNGYAEAKKKAKERREQVEKHKTEENQVEEKPVKRSFPAITFIKKYIRKTFDIIFNEIKKVYRTCASAVGKVFHSSFTIGNVTTRVLGPVGVIWTYIVSIKRGVCPVLEFLDETSIRQAQQIAKECEGENFLDADEIGKYRYAKDRIKFFEDEPLQAVFSRFLGDEKDAEAKQTPIRVKAYIGLYVTSQIGFDEVLNRISKDIKTLEEIKISRIKSEALRIAITFKDSPLNSQDLKYYRHALDVINSSWRNIQSTDPEDYKFKVHTYLYDCVLSPFKEELRKWAYPNRVKCHCSQYLLQHIKEEDLTSALLKDIKTLVDEIKNADNIDSQQN